MKDNKYIITENVYDNFLSLHNELRLIEKAPEKYTGETVYDICALLNIQTGKPAKIKTPIDKIIININHIKHLVEDNNKERKGFLNYALRTMQEPNLIIKNGEKHKYFKLFNDADKIKVHLQIVKVKSDGSFYVTNFRPTKKQVYVEIKEGQIIYDLSNVRDGITSANTSIANNGALFNLNT